MQQTSGRATPFYIINENCFLFYFILFPAFYNIRTHQSMLVPFISGALFVNKTIMLFPSKYAFVKIFLQKRTRS